MGAKRTKSEGESKATIVVGVRLTRADAARVDALAAKLAAEQSANTTIPIPPLDRSTMLRVLALRSLDEVEARQSQPVERVKPKR